VGKGVTVSASFVSPDLNPALSWHQSPKAELTTVSRVGLLGTEGGAASESWQSLSALECVRSLCSSVQDAC
jgi:hypothetical protein